MCIQWGNCFDFEYSLTKGITKNLLKITRHKKKKHNNFDILARSKSNSIATMVSLALISHEKYKRIIDGEEKYRRLKEDIKIMKIQESDCEKDKLIEEGNGVESNNENETK